MKRVIDVTMAALLLVAVSPVMLLAALSVVIADGTPVFFVQQRDGRRGERFTVIKFRTMRADGDEMLQEVLRTDPSARDEWASYLRLRDDPRLIPVVGRLLRRWSIDEIPQFLNVVRGDMSLVGPRPLALDVLDRFPSDFIAARRSVRPGLTGLWQVSGRSEGDLAEWRRLDEEYLDRRSIVLDLRILARTPRAVLSRTGAF